MTDPLTPERLEQIDHMLEGRTSRKVSGGWVVAKELRAELDRVRTALAEARDALVTQKVEVFAGTLNKIQGNVIRTAVNGLTDEQIRDIISVAHFAGFRLALLTALEVPEDDGDDLDEHGVPKWIGKLPPAKYEPGKGWLD